MFFPCKLNKIRWFGRDERIQWCIFYENILLSAQEADGRNNRWATCEDLHMQPLYQSMRLNDRTVQSEQALQQPGLTHYGRTTHCLSRQKEVNNNNNIHNKHQLFCLLYSWYIGWHNNCGDFSYCNRHPSTNSKLKLSIYNLLDATSL